MNTKSILILCATLILIGIFFWPTIYRYDSMTINGNILPTKTNRITGFTEYYMSGAWHSEGGNKKIKPLPEGERNKVTVKSGEGKLTSYEIWNTPFTDIVKTLNAEVYNGSNWTITSLVIQFKIEDDKNIKLIGSEIIPPLSTGIISIKSPESFKGWEVYEIRGYRD